VAIISDFTTLSDAVAGYLNRSDLTAYVPNFIRDAELLIYNDARHRGVETEFAGNTAAGVLALSGLTNFREFKWLRASAAGGALLKPVSITEMYERYPLRSEQTALPSHYARDGANIVFGPAGAGTIALDGVYYSLLAPLSASNTTNWYTTNAPSVLLFGALMQAQPFMPADARIPIWATFLKEARDAIQETARRENKTHTPRAVRVL
jgi:hypothetical protein